MSYHLYNYPQTGGEWLRVRRGELLALSIGGQISDQSREFGDYVYLNPEDLGVFVRARKGVNPLHRARRYIIGGQDGIKYYRPYSPLSDRGSLRDSERRLLQGLKRRFSEPLRELDLEGIKFYLERV